MFNESPELAPISMILTNLATHSYNGESDIFTAVRGIVDRMPSFIRAGRPRVPNPADPAEDYADKWSRDPKLEQNFWSWHMQAKADLARLPDLLRGDRLAASVRQMVPAGSDTGAVAAIPTGARFGAQRLLRRAGDRHH